jgi:hypothetical protein
MTLWSARESVSDLLDLSLRIFRSYSKSPVGFRIKTRFREISRSKVGSGTGMEGSHWVFPGSCKLTSPWCWVKGLASLYLQYKYEFYNNISLISHLRSGLQEIPWQRYGCGCRGRFCFIPVPFRSHAFVRYY